MLLQGCDASYTSMSLVSGWYSEGESEMMTKERTFSPSRWAGVKNALHYPLSIFNRAPAGCDGRDVCLHPPNIGKYSEWQIAIITQPKKYEVFSTTIWYNDELRELSRRWYFRFLKLYFLLVFWAVDWLDPSRMKMISVAEEVRFYHRKLWHSGLGYRSNSHQ